MTRLIAMVSEFQSGERWLATRRLAGVMMRYTLSALGPMSIAGAHFIASLIFLHGFSTGAFGIFSFVLVIVVPFALSSCGALLNAPLARAAHMEGARDEALAVYFKASLVFAVIAAVCGGGLLLASGADARLDVILAVYCGTMTMRWFARCHAYTVHHPLQAVASDLAYSVFLVGALSALYTTQSLSENHAGAAMFAASLLGLAAFGWSFVRPLLASLKQGALSGYRIVWRDLTRWSLLGVVSTELTMNAHAYLVTFIFGPKSFALLAVGSLFMRPVSLALTALPDLERPIMARHVANGNVSHAWRAVKEFRTAAGAVWLATLVLAAMILIWFPSLLLKPEYDVTQVIVVIALWATIMAVRTMRTPESVLLQAAGEFRTLAMPSVWSSLVSVGATLALLLAFGPIASLAGILIGDLVMTTNVLALTRRWRAVRA